jgi:acyl dehydratase
MSQLRNRAAEGLSVGDTFQVSRTLTQDDVVRFADISRDYNPVHFDDRFSDVKGFAGRICHGLLVASLLTEIGGQIGWLASGMHFRFRRPVYFGDTVTCTFRITAIEEKGRAEGEAVFTNQSGQTVLEGVIRGRVPGPVDRAVLRVMLREGDPTNGIRQ